MSKDLFLILLAVASTPAFAIDFQFEKDHCAAGEYKPVNPHSGGTQSGMFGLDNTAWAETGLCIKMPIEKLQAAASDINVMTWEGTTKIASVEKQPNSRPNDVFRVKVTYESKHKHVWCQSAQWPMLWMAQVIDGSASAPAKSIITVDRVPGGDSNGGYIKQMSGKIELVKAANGDTSLHMRWEVAAPGQLPDWAVGAITGYADRLTKVAAGGKAPGAAEDPECPYNE